MDDLEDKTKEYEEHAVHFNEMVQQRRYTQAREYFRELNKESQDYINNHPEYRWSIKALRVSCI